MQSNRELFQEIREGESQEIPPQEEPRPKTIRRKRTLMERVDAYEAAVRRNKIRTYGLEKVLERESRPKTDLSGIETRPLHNHAKPLTAIQKEYQIKEPSPEIKKEHLKSLEGLSDKLKNLKIKRSEI